MPCCQQLFDCRCRWWWCWCWWCCRCRCGSCCFPEVRCEPNKIHIFINIMSMDHMDLQTNHIYRWKQGMACQDHLFIDAFFSASLGMTIPGILRTFYLDLRQQGERTVGFERYQGEEHTVHLCSGRYRRVTLVAVGCLGSYGKLPDNNSDPSYVEKTRTC